MRRRVVSLALAALVAIPLTAQTISFTRNFQSGDGLSEPSQIPMVFHPSGIFLAGLFHTGAYLARYDTSGTQTWIRQVANPDGVYPIAMAIDGGASAVYVAGRIGRGGTAAFLRKYDSAGTEMWARQFRAADTAAYHNATGVAVDSSGVYVGAWNGFADGLVRKYSPAGDELWSRSFTVRSFGGVVADGTGVYVAFTTDQGGVVRRYTAAGAEQWTKPLGAGPLAADSTGLYVGGGEFVTKVDPNGNEVWTRRFASGRGAVVALTAGATGVYAAGDTDAALPGQCHAGDLDAFVRKFDSQGNEQWTRQFGSPGGELVGGIAVDASGTYVSGGSWSFPQSGGFLTKLAKTATPPQDGRPSILNECVLNAANYLGGAVAPGEIITIFGTAMGPATLTASRADGGRVPTTVDGARILFSGIAAPLLYVSATQSSAVVPYAISEKQAVTVEVEYLGTRSSPVVLPVVSTRPALFSRDGSGRGAPLVINEDGSVNTPQNPAARGSILTIYVTGDGVPDRVVPDGTIFGESPAVSAVSPVIWFDDPSDPDSGLNAEILTARGVPGSVAGLLQVRFRVPATTRTGDSVAFYYQGAGALAVALR